MPDFAFLFPEFPNMHAVAPILGRQAKLSHTGT